MDILSLSKKRKNIIFAGVLITMLLSAMDTTIVGTIMPKIVADIDGFSIYGWVFSIYMLSVVVSLSIFGKLTDLYGRKYFYLSGLVIFIIGSILCGFANTMELLIVFRAIQGIGGGLLTGISPTITGDLFSPKERPKYQGFLGGIFGLATIIGPIVGGLLTDLSGWRLSFFINVPIGIVAIFLIYKFLPNFKTREAKKQIDVLGCILFVIFILLLLFSLNSAGSTLAWSDPGLLGLFALVILILIVFTYVERKSKEPILPIKLFSNSIFNISAISGVVMGMIMYAATLFIPLFIEGIMGYSVIQTGLIMLPMTILLVLANIISGIWVSRTGKYKNVLLISFLFMLLGVALLVVDCRLKSVELIIVAMGFIGAGMGISFPTFMNVAQNAVPYEYLGVASSSTQFFRNFGGIIGVTLFSTLMNNSLWTELQNKLMSVTSQIINVHKLIDMQLLLNDSRIGELDSAIKKMENAIPDNIIGDFIKFLKDGLNNSLMYVFIVLLIFCVVIFFMIALFLKEIPLRKTNSVDED